MLNRKTTARAGNHWLLVALALPISACMAYNDTTSDVDRTPIMNAGTRAGIIYPGQGAPAMPGSVPQTQYAPPGTGSQYGQPPVPERQAPPAYPSGAPVPPGAAPAPQPYANPQANPYPVPQANPAPNDQISMLGGSRIEETKHLDKRNEPLVLKYMMAPLKLLAAPFILAKEAFEGDPEPGPALPRRADPQLPSAQQSGAAPPPQPQATDYESAMLQDLERQLEQRGTPEPRRAPEPRVASAPTRSLSIADELRELQRAPEAPQRRVDRPSHPAPSARVEAPQGQEPGNPYPTASGIVDRNNDGRIDQWIFRENGEIAKEVLDEDFDGRPDRTIVFDAQTHRPGRVEEDTSGDGVLDSWTDYDNGAIARRRSDSNGDGTVDTWSFFRAGELARHEQDTSGDGFRDVVSFFEEGRRVREERDANGDGQADEILYYDSSEKLLRREEDRDKDGELEVVSHYEAGRLVRRELLEAPTLAGRLSEAEAGEATR
jgi:antitoxin component YwqK of YwqJK toxin-antitoxin module